MKERIDYRLATRAYHSLLELEKYLRECGLDDRLLNLIKVRASQINGWAYCLDMHWKELRALGEGEQRLYSLDAWRESPYYSERGRAALAWVEAITLVSEIHVPDEIYDEVKKHFSEKELADLTMAAVAINAWNRLAIASRITPGKYKPGIDLKDAA